MESFIGWSGRHEVEIKVNSNYNKIVLVKHLVGMAIVSDQSNYKHGISKQISQIFGNTLFICNNRGNVRSW